VDVTPSSATGADLVYAQLRKQILTGVLTPGLVVSQVQLARELGVSRTPLREAVRMLQREGLVAGEANRMIRIASFSIADVEELYAVRIANEALAIRLTVPKMTDDDDAALDQSIADLSRTAIEGDTDAWNIYHRTFHTRLVSGSGKRLRTLLSELYDYAERYRHLYRTAEPRAMSIGAQEHEQIVEACHARDGVRASDELVRHLSRTALTALTAIAPEYEPALVRSALRALLSSPNGTSNLDQPLKGQTEKGTRNGRK
jgi:DNA-binding GntR family transcriptional regulator